MKGKIKEFTMTDDQLKKIMDACKPTLAIKVGSYFPRTPQDNANDAWRQLGEEMGFKGETARPIQGKNDKHFTAVSSDD